MGTDDVLMIALAAAATGHQSTLTRDEAWALAAEAVAAVPEGSDDRARSLFDYVAIRVGERAYPSLR